MRAKFASPRLRGEGGANRAATSLALALALAAAAPAAAQTYHDSSGATVPGVVPLYGCSAAGNCAGPVSGSNPLPVSGTFSASLSGFEPTPAYAQLSVGASSARVALPTGTVVVAYNTGSTAAYMTLGDSSVVATTSNDVIEPGSWLAFTAGPATYLAAIETAGATSLNISGGSGLPTGAGSGGGAGGSLPTGPAGSPNANVVTVQGISGAAPLNVDGSGVTQPVSGTFWQATQPVSLAALPALASGANVIGGVTQSGTWSLTDISGTISLPTGAATSANQTNASQKTQIVDGSGNVIGSTSNNLNVQCANCSGSGVSTGDNSAFSAGSSLFAGVGGEYATGLGALTAGHQAMAALTPYRALQTDWYNSSGAEMGTAGSPVQVSLANTAENATAVKVDGSAVTQPVSGTVTANAGTNLNTSALALESGGNLASVATSTARTNAGVSATNALPVQGVSGGVALPVSGTLAATQSGTWNVTNVSGTVSLPTGAATSANQSTEITSLGTIATNSGTQATAANQTNASQKTQIVDGSGNVIGSTSNNLNVQCANCSGSGVSTGDDATFTAGSSLFAGVGGEYATGLSALTAGHQAMAALTPYRALQTDWYNSSGVEMGTAGSPVQVSLANTGANAAAVKVDGSAVTQPVSGTVTANAGTNLNTSALALESGGNLASVATSTARTNAGVSATNALPVQGVSGGVALPVSGTLAATQSGTWNVTNVSGTVSLPTGAATSANQSIEITSLGTIATNSGTQATAANQTSVIGAKAPGTAAASSLLGGGVYTSAGVSLTNGQQAALQFDSTGHLLTTASLAGSTSNASSGVATSSTNLAGVSWLYGFNGTTWDQLKDTGGSLHVLDDNSVTPGRSYNTIAASQTAQALTGGSGGATGDYLSHCVVFPATTSPGAVTILDNSTTIDAFAGGASSVSNLVPFTIPVGAVSVSGAWKVTTGANVSVTCSGKFT